jgi:hypothetical protein
VTAADITQCTVRCGCMRCSPYSSQGVNHGHSPELCRGVDGSYCSVVARQRPWSLVNHAALTGQTLAPVGWLQGLSLLNGAAPHCRGMDGVATVPMS